MDWVKFLPLAFFALRQMPHKNSGLSPFDLVYSGWLEDVCEGVCMSKWVDTLQSRINELTDLSVSHRKKMKDKSRESRNMTRVNRKLEEGSSVLMKIPGRRGGSNAHGAHSRWERL